MLVIVNKDIVVEGQVIHRAGSVIDVEPSGGDEMYVINETKVAEGVEVEFISVHELDVTTIEDMVLLPGNIKRKDYIALLMATRSMGAKLVSGEAMRLKAYEAITSMAVDKQIANGELEVSGGTKDERAAHRDLLVQEAMGDEWLTLRSAVKAAEAQLEICETTLEVQRFLLKQEEQEEQSRLRQQYNNIKAVEVEAREFIL